MTGYKPRAFLLAILLASACAGSLHAADAHVPLALSPRRNDPVRHQKAENARGTGQPDVPRIGISRWAKRAFDHLYQQGAEILR